MKNITFMVVFLSFILASCNKDASIDKVDETCEFKENVPYSFELVTKPSVWATFKSLKEMQDACQIPENWLDKISTKNLIETCMNYPLYGMYMAYNNEMDGIKEIMCNFNGFQELKKRGDAAEKLLDYYDNVSVATKSNGGNLDILNPIHIGYLELILA